MAFTPADIASDIFVSLALNRFLPAPSGAPGPPGPAGAPGTPAPSPEPFGSGPFFDETQVQRIYVDPVNGNDLTGTGLSITSPVQTVPRALRLLPPFWTADVEIPLPAGTIAGAQGWFLPVLPGPKKTVPALTGRVHIFGDTTAVQALASNAGVLTAGASALFDFNVGAYAAVVTDGSHYVRVPQATFGFNGFAALASTSPNLQLNTISGTALANPELATWNTIFSGIITMRVPPMAGDVTSFFRVSALRFNVIPVMAGVLATCCKFDIGASCNNSSLISCVHMSGTTLYAGNSIPMTALTRLLIVAGTLDVTQGSKIAALTAVVYLGAPAGLAKLTAGHTSSGQMGAFTIIRLHNQCDYRGTGDGINLRNTNMCIAGGATAGTFILTAGRPLLAQMESKVQCLTTGTWTGTATLPAQLNDGSVLSTHGAYAVANSAAAGQDIIVGELAVQALATRPTTSPVELCRYN